MAKNKSTVYLGYEDEEITDKHVSYLNSRLNKIGGNPDWPNGDIKIPSCPLCGTVRPLIVQLYAPLEYSQFHRTLYIFACLNPLCSQNCKSWFCVRTQHLDTPSHGDLIKAVTTSSKIVSNAGKSGGVGNIGKKKKMYKTTTNKILWCSGIDDWGENTLISLDTIEKMDTAGDECDDNEENVNEKSSHEENGNVIRNKNENMLLALNEDLKKDSVVLEVYEEDDEDDSNSMENEIISGFLQMQMNPSQQIGDDPNANCADAAAAVSIEKDGNYACSGGGNGATAVLCAEIEGSETDVVLVETPKKPERDLIALLRHSTASTSLGPLTKTSDITLKPYFIAVEVEAHSQTKEYEHYAGALSSEHIRDLYQEYKKQDEASSHSPNGGGQQQSVGACIDDKERYENVLPAHGDVMFHNFLSSLQKNPGQVLRYSRDTLPLLIAPLKEALPKCPNCSGETICEVQLLPTLIPKLKMQKTQETAPIEYGNILIFTCLKSCWDTPDKMRYERVIVQAENYSLSDNWI